MTRSIGRYTIDKKLAAGGMGEVYLGRIAGGLGFARPVVVKRVRPEIADSTRGTRMFFDEAILAAQLHHRNLVETFDFGEHEGAWYLVTEYVEGTTLGGLLRAWSKRGWQARYALCVAIFAEVAAGLAAAHGASAPDGGPLGLVHRDVSPSNILLGRNGEVKIADFGVAKARARHYETMSGTIKGKIPYMAPEQIRGQPLDYRADLFGLGVLMYELSTLSPLYSRMSPAEAVDQILAGAVPDPTARHPDFPAELAHTIRRALASDREDRHATATAILDELDALSRARRWSRNPAALADAVLEIAA